MILKLPFPRRKKQTFQSLHHKTDRLMINQPTTMQPQLFFTRNCLFVKWTRSYFRSTILLDQSLNYVRNRALGTQARTLNTVKTKLTSVIGNQKRNGSELLSPEEAKKSAGNIFFPGKIYSCICLCMYQIKIERFWKIRGGWIFITNTNQRL